VAFADKRSLQRHTQRKHVNVRPDFVCARDSCGRVFGTKLEWRLHENTCHAKV
jgi:hypothetical protein